MVSIENAKAALDDLTTALNERRQQSNNKAEQEWIEECLKSINAEQSKLQLFLNKAVAGEIDATVAKLESIIQDNQQQPFREIIHYIQSAINEMSPGEKG